MLRGPLRDKEVPFLPTGLTDQSIFMDGESPTVGAPETLICRTQHRIKQLVGPPNVAK